MKEDLDEVDERHIPTAGGKHPNHGDAFAHRTGAYQCRSSHVRIDLRGSVDLSSLVWALAFGFGGAFISLAFSKQMARAMLDCRQITQPRSQAEQVIYGAVQEIAQRLHITMPEVWVYESPDPNAFATGPSKNNSMVAVSTGLLSNLQEQEVRAVLAHEMGHVYNGDMFATTVLAGLMNTFVYYIAMWVRRFFAERDQADARFWVVDRDPDHRQYPGLGPDLLVFASA